jgi:hypothetical protein
MGDEVEDEEVMLTITPRKFRKWDLMAISLQSIGHIMSVVSDGFIDSAGLLLRHSEYEQMRHNFHEDAASEMETLIAEVEGME